MKNVIIKKIPQQKTYSPKSGDQVDYSLHTGQSGIYNKNDFKTNTLNIRSSYPEVDRDEANIEVEQGEIIVNSDLTGIYKINGKKHSKGGTPIKAKEGSYVISDHIKVIPDVLTILDLKQKGKSKKTWAELLQSHIDSKTFNTHNAILKDKAENKHVDIYEFNTAKNKIEDYKNIVSKVILGNELSKAMMGKSFEVPALAQPALESMQNDNSYSEEPLAKAQDGMTVKEPYVFGNIPDYGNVKGIVNASRLSNKYSWFKPFATANTKKGLYTPTGETSTFKGNPNSQYNNIDYWEKRYGKPFNNMKEFQGYMFGELQKYNPQAYNNIMKKWGETNAGTLIDGLGGERTEEAMGSRIPETPPQETPPNLVPPVEKMFSQQTKPYKSFTFDNPPKGNDKVGYDWLDQMTLLESMRRNPTYFPKTFIPQAVQYNPQLEDPNYYPMLSAQRTRSEMTNQFGNPQTARATLSYQPDMVQGILGENQRVSSNNLQTVNQAAQYNNQMFNNYNANVANLRTQDYDKNVLTRVNKDTERKLQANDTLGAIGNMRMNRDQMRYYLSQNPQYGLTNPNDYSSSLGFISGRDRNDSATEQSAPSLEESFNSILNMTKGLKPETIEAIGNIYRAFNNNDRRVTRQDYTQTKQKIGPRTINRVDYD